MDKMEINGKKVVAYIPNTRNIEIIYEFEDGSKAKSQVIAWAVLENGDLIPVDKTPDLDSTIYILSNIEYLAIDNSGNSINIDVKNIRLKFND